MRGRLLAVLVAALSLTLGLHGFSLAELGGERGPKFQLFGGATDATDPQNPTNDVVAINNTANFGAVSRDIFKGTKVEMLDNQLQLRYLFVPPKSCGVGSPRIQLRIDRDGDGTGDGNAFGYLGDRPFGGGCPSGEWVIEDMTNAQRKWDVSQFGGPMSINWDEMEAFFQGVYPNHQVVRGSLVEDPDTPTPGVTYYDSLVIGNRDVNVSSDTAR